MRKYARLREPYKCNENEQICKIMLYETEEGICLFGYGSEDAVHCSSDLLYDSLDDLYEEWNDRIDEKGWIEIEDPLPGCQHDAFTFTLETLGQLADGRGFTHPIDSYH